MRKIYLLLVLFVAQFSIASAQADVANFTFTVNAPTLTTTFANTSTIGIEPGERHALWIFGDGTSARTGISQVATHQYANSGTYNVCLKIYRYRSATNDSVVTADICKTVVIENSCGANFERLLAATLNNPMRAEFRALPTSNTSRKPSKICWTFGDNKDTCINYTENYTGPLTVGHTYAANGQYEVCVTITYFGGCVARKCQMISINRPDSCDAGFIRQPGASANNALRTEFKALPWHINGKKPSKVCWTFGDNRDTCINYTDGYTGYYTVNHTYAAPGEYEVCVKITYFGGCEKRVCKRIRVPERNEPRLILTPNPVHNEVHALYYSTYAGPVTIRIMSSNTILRSYSRVAVVGVNNWGFDLTSLTPGIYAFVVQAPNHTARVMFLKI